MIASHLEYSAELLKSYADKNYNILITGNSGSGKTYIANEVLKHLFQKIAFIDCALYESCDFNFFYKDLKEKLNESKNGAIIFDNIKDLRFEFQKSLYALLHQRNDGSLIHFDNDKIKSERQFVFISNGNYTLLSEMYVPLLNFISQQIIHLPDFTELDFQQMKEAFRALWNQNQFNQPLKSNITFNEKDEQYEYVFEYLAKQDLSNNFHDLQKIAILIWREKFVMNRKNLDLFFNAVVQNPFEEFENWNKIPQSNNLLQHDGFKANVKADEMVKDFKKQLTKWAEEQYKNFSKARMYEMLDISEKTFYNWKNRK